MEESAWYGVPEPLHPRSPDVTTVCYYYYSHSHEGKTTSDMHLFNHIVFVTNCKMNSPSTPQGDCSDPGEVPVAVAHCLPTLDFQCHLISYADVLDPGEDLPSGRSSSCN